MTNAQLVSLIRDTETRMGLKPLTGVSRMRKAELIASVRVLVILAETEAYAENARRSASEPCCVTFADGWHLASCPTMVEWPTEEDHADAVSAFDDGDASDVLATWGDLRATLTEARGWLSDCGIQHDYRGDAEVVHLVSRLYGGGLAEFALNTVML